MSAEPLTREAIGAVGRPVVDTDVDTVVDAVVDLVVPVHNEERSLETAVRRLDDYLRELLPYSYRITIADNASTDGTWLVASRLAAELPSVGALHLDAKGRGRALRAAWTASSAEIVGYMDVDLSTDLRAVLPLLAPLLSGHSDLAIGTRLAPSSRVVRGPKRDVISRGYNLLLRTVLSVSFSDAQCGFKALRRDVAERLLPLVEDESWFFDTELLVLAQEAGLRIHEVPVDWVDDPDSRVDIVSTAVEDLRGIGRLARGLASGRIGLDAVKEEVRRPPARPAGGMWTQVLRFGAIGVVSTLAYLLLYVLLRGAMGEQAANLVALVVTAVANTAANRRITFGIRSRTGAVRHHAAGLAAFGLGLALTSGALWLLHHLAASPGRVAEVAVLVIANALATLLRFLTLRRSMA